VNVLPPISGSTDIRSVPIAKTASTPRCPLMANCWVKIRLPVHVGHSAPLLTTSVLSRVHSIGKLIYLLLGEFLPLLFRWLRSKLGAAGFHSENSPEVLRIDCNRQHGFDRTPSAQLLRTVIFTALALSGPRRASCTLTRFGPVERPPIREPSVGSCNCG